MQIRVDVSRSTFVYIARREGEGERVDYGFYGARHHCGQQCCDRDICSSVLDVQVSILSDSNVLLNSSDVITPSVIAANGNKVSISLSESEGETTLLHLSVLAWVILDSSS